MNTLKWTKSYDLYVQNKHFRVFISEHDGKQFYASCLWYDDGRALKAPGQKGNINIDLEKRVGNSEQDALDQIMEWVKSKFGKDYILKESETSKHK